MRCKQSRAVWFDLQKSDVDDRTERQIEIRTDVHLERQTRAAHAAAIFIEGGGGLCTKSLQTALYKIYWTIKNGLLYSTVF